MTILIVWEERAFDRYHTVFKVKLRHKGGQRTKPTRTRMQSLLLTMRVLCELPSYMVDRLHFPLLNQ